MQQESQEHTLQHLSVCCVTMRIFLLLPFSLLFKLFYVFHLLNIIYKCYSPGQGDRVSSSLQPLVQFHGPVCRSCCSCRATNSTVMCELMCEQSLCTRRIPAAPLPASPYAVSKIGAAFSRFMMKKKEKKKQLPKLQGDVLKVILYFYR